MGMGMGMGICQHRCRNHGNGNGNGNGQSNEQSTRRAIIIVVVVVHSSRSRFSPLHGTAGTYLWGTQNQGNARFRIRVAIQFVARARGGAGWVVSGLCGLYDLCLLSPVASKPEGESSIHT